MRVGLNEKLAIETLKREGFQDELRRLRAKLGGKQSHAHDKQIQDRVRREHLVEQLSNDLRKKESIIGRAPDPSNQQRTVKNGGKGSPRQSTG